jgi:hypothetical protein
MFPGHWGLGTELFDWDGTAAVGHDGDTPGQSAVWRVIPEHGLVVAMSVTGPGGTGLVMDVLLPVIREVTGVAVPDPLTPPDSPPPLGDVSGYLGRFAGPLLAYEVTDTAGGLEVTLVPTEYAVSLGAQRRTGRFLRLSGETFIAEETMDGRHETITFVDNGRYLHNSRAVPRVPA